MFKLDMYWVVGIFVQFCVYDFLKNKTNHYSILDECRFSEYSNLTQIPFIFHNYSTLKSWAQYSLIYTWQPKTSREDTRQHSIN